MQQLSGGWYAVPCQTGPAMVVISVTDLMSSWLTTMTIQGITFGIATYVDRDITVKDSPSRAERDLEIDRPASSTGRGQ